MMNNLELLRAFSVVARSRSFAEAATALRISVSAVSQQMKALNGLAGVSLFERRGRRAALTSEGQALLDAVVGPLQALDAALEVAALGAREVVGTVRIGGPRAFGRHWLRPRLPRLMEMHPRLRLKLVFDVASHLEPRLVAGDLDFAILTRPSELPGLHTRRLATESFVAVAAPHTVSERKPPRTADDFRARRWMVFDTDLAMHAPWWRAHFGLHAPLPQDLVGEVAGVDELLALAEEGVGSVVLPDYLVEEALEKRRLVRLVPSAPPARPPRNTLFLAWRSQAPETARFAVTQAVLLEGAMR